MSILVGLPLLTIIHTCVLHVWYSHQAEWVIVVNINDGKCKLLTVFMANHLCVLSFKHMINWRWLIFLWSTSLLRLHDSTLNDNNSVIIIPTNIIINWLVVYLPLWKIWKSVGIMTFPIYGKSAKKSWFQTTNQSSSSSSIIIIIAIVMILFHPFAFCWVDSSHMLCFWGQEVPYSSEVASFRPSGHDEVFHSHLSPAWVDWVGFRVTLYSLQENPWT